MGKNIFNANDNKDMAGLARAVGYDFGNHSLLRQAVTHASYVAESSSPDLDNNETLEFLGDAVLDLVITAMLIRFFPEEKEGRLTLMRASLVNERQLAAMARTISLGSYLRLGKGEEGAGGRTKDSILACAFEALTGAIFSDGGYDAAAAFIQARFEPLMASGGAIIGRADSKNLLQEFLQARHGAGPSYEVEKEEGPAHCRIFTVSVWFDGERLGEGVAGSKKEAEKEAAAVALRLLRDREPSGANEGRDESSS